MTQVREEGPLSQEDARLIRRMREGFEPELLTGAAAAAFDARLHDRLEHPASRRWLWAALATGAAVAVTFLALPGVEPRLEPRPVPSADTLAWEDEVIFGEGLGNPLAVEDGDLLPPDYLALARAFDF